MLATIAMLVVAPQTSTLSRLPWWEASLGKLKRQGYLVGYPDGLASPRNRSTRWEHAAKVYAAYSLIKRIDADDSPEAAIEDVDVSEIRATVRTVVHLTTKFNGELLKLGADPAQMKRDLNAIDLRFAKLPVSEGDVLLPFPDVPRSHWASSSIRNLGREGILRGYPDGTFSGSTKR